MSFRSGASLFCVECDVAGVPSADFATVDALARASLNARRLGTRLRVVNASADLEQLIGFAGLDDVLLGRRRRQTEEREETIRVEERRVPDDPPV
jgi:anti-anti-sigma regulatory factor